MLPQSLLGTRRKIRKPWHLTRAAIGVMGFWEMGEQDFNEMARCLDVPAWRLRATALVLRYTDNPEVRFWMDAGLPPGACAFFHSGGEEREEVPYYRCPLCHCAAASVPCYSCSVRPFKSALDEPDDFQPRPPRLPTRTIPGSLQKKRIMQARAALHLALFHPDDYVYDYRKSDRVSLEGIRL